MTSPLNDNVSPITPKRRKLTMKQEGFVKDLLETKNASEAVRRNYDVENAAPGTVTSIASENLSKPSIQEAIGKLKEQFVSDSYFMYGQQKEILSRVSARNPELANKIINKTLDRAGFAPVHKNENKSMTAKFVITRGIEPQGDTSIVPDNTYPLERI